MKRVRDYLNDEDFCFTYGDGVSDINISELIKQHKKSNKLATVTVVQPPGRYGTVEIIDNEVKGFIEKPKGDGGWINGGFFVLNPKVIDYIDGDSTPWESLPMEKLASSEELNAFFHTGFWKPMDTLRDKIQLEELIIQNKAPWIKW